MQTASSRIWIHVAPYNSYHDNRYITSTSMKKFHARSQVWSIQWGLNSLFSSNGSVRLACKPLYYDGMPVLNVLYMNDTSFMASSLENCLHEPVILFFCCKGIYKYKLVNSPLRTSMLLFILQKFYFALGFILTTLRSPGLDG